MLVLGCGLEAALPGAVVPSTTGDTGSTSSDVASSSDAGSSGDLQCTGPFASTPPTAWPSYGLDPGNSRYNPNERAIDPESVGCLVPRWSTDGLAGVTSTPAVEGGTVYFGDWDGSVHARDVV